MSSFPAALALSALGYLFVVSVLAVAVWLVLRRSKDGRGSGCGGCLIALALFFAAALGAVGCTALTVAGLSSEVVRHGPVRSVEFRWTDSTERQLADWRAERDEHRPRRWQRPSSDDERYPVRLRIELDRDIDVSRLSRWIRDELDGDVLLRYEALSGENGENGENGPRARLDFGLPIDPEDIDEFQRELRRELPELDLPDSVKIEIRDPGE